MRAKYHLGRLLVETDSAAKEGELYLIEAERARNETGLWTGDKSENPEYPENLTPTEVHDLMVPIWAGRTTFTQPRPWAAKKMPTTFQVSQIIYFFVINIRH